MSETENENTENVEAAEPAADDTPVAEEAPAAEETSPEAPTTDADAPEPAAEAEQPAEPADDATPPAAERAEPPAEAPAAQPEPKRKRKRLPRSERHKHSKPRRERPATRKPIARAPKPVSERGRRQERRGVVVSDTMDKTIVVKVDTIKAHTKYKKVVRRSTKFHADDPENRAKVGDLVRIVETRPLSKTKNWRLVEVVEAAK
jgi:small subunit ribosomal protein S17